MVVASVLTSFSGPWLDGGGLTFQLVGNFSLSIGIFLAFRLLINGNLAFCRHVDDFLSDVVGGLTIVPLYLSAHIHVSL
jgi:hypothetical protein